MRCDGRVGQNLRRSGLGDTMKGHTFELAGILGNFTFSNFAKISSGDANGVVKGSCCLRTEKQPERKGKRIAAGTDHKFLQPNDVNWSMINAKKKRNGFDFRMFRSKASSNSAFAIATPVTF